MKMIKFISKYMTFFCTKQQLTASEIKTKFTAKSDGFYINILYFNV